MPATYLRGIHSSACATTHILPPLISFTFLSVYAFGKIPFAFESLVAAFCSLSRHGASACLLLLGRHAFPLGKEESPKLKTQQQNRHGTDIICEIPRPVIISACPTQATRFLRLQGIRRGTGIPTHTFSHLCWDSVFFFALVSLPFLMPPCYETSRHFWALSDTHTALCLLPMPCSQGRNTPRVLPLPCLWHSLLSLL